MPSFPTPTVGRDVHYWSRGSADGQFPSVARAAKITEVHHVDHDAQEYVVSLAVFNPTGLFFDQHVTMSPSGEPGHWSWPPRV